MDEAKLEGLKQRCGLCGALYMFVHVCPRREPGYNIAYGFPPQAVKETADTQLACDPWCAPIPAEQKQQTPLTIDCITVLLQNAIHNGWHSEKIARELCRKYGGQMLPRIE